MNFQVQHFSLILGGPVVPLLSLNFQNTHGKFRIKELLFLYQNINVGWMIAIYRLYKYKLLYANERRVFFLLLGLYTFASGMMCITFPMIFFDFWIFISLCEKFINREIFAYIWVAGWKRIVTDFVLLLKRECFMLTCVC